MVDINVIGYSISENQIHCYKPNEEFPKVSKNQIDINNFFSATTILLSSIKESFLEENAWNLESSNTEYSAWSRHIAYYAFYIENYLCIPLPGLIFTTPLPQELNNEIFQERHELASQFNLIQLHKQNISTVNSGYKHKHPDFIIIHCVDYFPFNDSQEPHMGGELVKGTEKWSQYIAPIGDLPTDEELKSTKGILIPGSKYCSYDFSLPWVQSLHDLIKKVYLEYTHIKLVGVCFGHQLINLALGGEVARNPSNDFVFKIEQLESVEPLEGLENVVLLESHSDCVIVPSPELVLKYTSCTAQNEILSNDRVLTFQGHPEPNSYLVGEFFAAYLHSKGTISEEHKNEVEEESRRLEISRNAVYDYINRFFRD